MSMTYRVDLTAQGIPKDKYQELEYKARLAVYRASAVDTGLFRSGWVVSISGDTLIVSNPVRYAGYVELGSVVHVKHQFRIRRALESLGLKGITLTYGSVSVPSVPSTKPNNPPNEPSTQPVNQPVNQPSVPRVPNVPTLTPQDVISPNKVIDKILPKPKIPTTQIVGKSPSKLIRDQLRKTGFHTHNLFNPTYLVALIALEANRRNNKAKQTKEALNEVR